MSTIDVWEAIYGAKTKADLRNALELVYRWVRALEVRLAEHRAGSEHGEGRREVPHQVVTEQQERLTRPFSVRLNEGDPDYFTVVLYNNEGFWVLSTESQQAAETVCRRLNKFLTGLIVAPGSMDTMRAGRARARRERKPGVVGGIVYVNSYTGSDANDGRTPGTGMETITAAMDVAAENDRIVVLPDPYAGPGFGGVLYLERKEE